jgi:hypothetical protein
MADTSNDNAENMENLADDALNEFGMKYDGTDEDISPNNSPVKNMSEATKEMEGKNKDADDSNNANKLVDTANDDEGKFGDAFDEDDDEQEKIDVGQKSNNIDVSTDNNNANNTESNHLWGFSGMNDPYGAFKMQDKTPQELAEEAAQQQAMWVAYVEELSEALSRRQNIVVTSGSTSNNANDTNGNSDVKASNKNQDNNGEDNGTISNNNNNNSDNSNNDDDDVENDALDKSLNAELNSPITLFSLCEQFDNVKTILADKTDGDEVDSDGNRSSWSAELINVLCALLPIFKNVLAETPLLLIPSKPASLTYPEAQDAAPPIKLPGTLPSNIVTTAGNLKPRCGILRVKVCSIISELVRLRFKEINQALISYGLIKSSIDLMFKYDCNNILHNAVTATAITILEGSHLPLQEELLVKCNLLDRILKAFEDNEAEIAMDKSRRRPYMGQLTIIAQVLNEVAVTGDRKFIDEHIKSNKKWSSFVETTLKPLEELHSRQIGGMAPPRQVVMQEEMNQGDIWNSLAQILSSFKGDSADGEDNQGGALDLAALMAQFGGMDQMDDDDEEEEEDKDSMDINVVPEDETETVSDLKQSVNNNFENSDNVSNEED